MTGVYGFLGEVENLKAKLVGILEGLNLAWEVGARNLLCYSNSLSALAIVGQAVEPMRRYAAIIRNIQALLAQSWTVRLCPTLREGNYCADAL